MHYNQRLDNNDNKNNTYTSFIDFSVVGLWQKKLQIIAIIDIK